MLHAHHQESQALCPACDIGPFTRNHYFTGKLLLERDFSDEQRYYIEKLRHHHQRLHGWGVVCGLKVTPHPQAACRDRFVCIEPGTAIDCCGHEIVVRDQECLDITRLDAIQTLIKQQDQDKEGHVLQICLRYRECPTEEIPVLYDECGCDDTRCAPNRILESYDVDVIVDPKEAPESFGTPKLRWENTVVIAHATRVALHDATHRLYVMTADNPAIVYQISTDNHATITSRALPAQGVALAVSNDGTHLYVIAESTTAADPWQLHVLDTTTQPGLQPIHPPSQADLGVGAAFLAVTPDNHLLALGSLSGDVLRWNTDIDTAASPVDPQTWNLGTTNLSGLVLSRDGNTGYVTDPTNDRVLTFNTTTLTPAAPIIAQLDGPLPAGAKPTALAVVSSTGSDLLAVADQINKKMHLLALTPPHPVGSVDLDHASVALVTSPGGRWVYVLEQDTTGSYVQSVSIDGLQLKLPVKPSAAFKVGNLSQQVVLSKSGTHLYIPFTDDPNNPELGGVAIVEVSEQACSEILWRHLDGCPHCDIPNCVVLATIENYHVGDKIEAQTDPPADPHDPLNKNIARIDNRKGRHLLPSTQVLTELVECLLEHGTGGADTKGEKGDKGDSVTGPKGDPGLDDVKLTLVDCGQPESGKIVTDNQGKRTLELTIPSGCQTDLTHICAINWTHQGTISRTSLTQDGLLIAFDQPVRSEDLHSQSLIVLEGHQSETSQLICWCEIPGKIEPGDFDAVCKIDSVFQTRQNVPVNGVRFRFEPGNTTSDTVFRVVLKGDYIRGFKDKGLDADHLPGWLPDRPTGDGIEGGTFESWFSVPREG